MEKFVIYDGSVWAVEREDANDYIVIVNVDTDERDYVAIENVRPY